MKVGKFIDLLAEHNLDADIIFQTNNNFECAILTTANCKCQEKEIIISIKDKKGAI